MRGDEFIDAMVAESDAARAQAIQELEAQAPEKYNLTSGLGIIHKYMVEENKIHPLGVVLTDEIVRFIAELEFDGYSGKHHEEDEKYWEFRHPVYQHEFVRIFTL